MSSTIERRAQRAIAETTRRRAEAVVRLAEVVARHEMAGDLIQAAVFTELLLEAQERVREDITHVRVGDHDPEPRRGKMRLDSYDANGHYGSDQCASHAPDPRDDYTVPASASHGPR